MSDTLYTSLLGVSVAQLVQNAGFYGINTGTCETLTDITRRYIEVVGSIAAEYANEDGRLVPNLDDVALALRHVGFDLPALPPFVARVRQGSATDMQ